MIARRFLWSMSALAVLVLSIALAACGSSEEDKDVHEGVPVELGDLQYNILFTRFLNPYDTEDKGYLVGQAPPGAEQVYVGVFVQIINKDKENPQTVPSGWTITDTEHNNYYPLPTESPYALALGEAIGPEDQAPALNSIPQVGPIEGSLILFLLPDTATEDLPLELLIPGEGGPAKVELDV